MGDENLEMFMTKQSKRFERENVLTLSVSLLPFASKTIAAE